MLLRKIIDHAFISIIGIITLKMRNAGGRQAVVVVVSWYSYSWSSVQHCIEGNPCGPPAMSLDP